MNFALINEHEISTNIPFFSAKSATLSSVRSLIRLGRLKTKDDERQRLLKESEKRSQSQDTGPSSSKHESAPPSLAGSVTSLETVPDSGDAKTTPEHRKK